MNTSVEIQVTGGTGKTTASGDGKKCDNACYNFYLRSP
jgi:hypothetical protein